MRLVWMGLIVDTITVLLFVFFFFWGGAKEGKKISGITNEKAMTSENRNTTIDTDYMQ